MAAHVVFVDAADWPVLARYLDELEEGGILVPPEAKASLAAVGDVAAVTYLAEYDYGGDAEVFVDIAHAGTYAYAAVAAELQRDGADE